MPNANYVNDGMAFLLERHLYRPSRHRMQYMNVKGSSTSYIRVPCGHCAECLRSKQNAFQQRCQYMTREYIAYFGTLTYDNEHLPKYTTRDGEVYRYADPRHFALMIKRLRKNGELPSGCKYVLVTEYGGRKHRPHFHFIFYVPKSYYRDVLKIDDTVMESPNLFPLYQSNFENQLYWRFRLGWKVNVGKARRGAIYEPLFQYRENARGERNFDFHLVRYKEQTDVTAVSAYVSKYILKFDKWAENMLKRAYAKYHNGKAASEYKTIYRLCRPRILTSKNFGFVWPDKQSFREEFEECIRSYVNSPAKCDYIPFKSPVDGYISPLARYYRRKLLTVDDLIKKHISVYGSLDVSRDLLFDLHTELRNLRQDNSDYISKHFEDIQLHLYNNYCDGQDFIFETSEVAQGSHIGNSGSGRVYWESCGS